jgi:hypothetical protein
MSDLKSKDIEAVEAELEVVEAVETEEVVAEETVEVEAELEAETPAEELVAEETDEVAEVEVVSEASEKDEEDEEDEEDEVEENAMPKTKAGILNAAVEMLKKANADEAKKIYASMVKMGDVKEEAESVVSEDTIESAIDSDEVLSEEFKERAAEIFNAELSEEVARIETESAIQLEEEVASFKTELVEKVDSYLNYAIDTWMTENALAIEGGLRTEIAEDFMTSLQTVFAEHYISVPEGKVDLVDELTDQVNDLEEQLNKTTDENVSLFTQVQEATRLDIVRRQSEGLAATEAEKLASLLEDVDYSDAESFEMKAKTVKESFFSGEATVSAEAELISEDVADEVTLTADMARYMTAMSKTKYV